MNEPADETESRAVEQIARGLAARWLRYHRWLDQAEGQVSRWLEPEGDGGDIPSRPDIRLLNTAVTTLRRIIESRRLLINWIRDERRHEPEGTDPSARSGITDTGISSLFEKSSRPEPDDADEDEMPD